MKYLLLIYPAVLWYWSDVFPILGGRELYVCGGQRLQPAKGRLLSPGEGAVTVQPNQKEAYRDGGGKQVRMDITSALVNNVYSG